jgi:tripartite-type tricarboxylate transporter receptor subunit TctC
MNTHFGVRMLHVPYKGTAPALNDLLGGHIQMMFTPVAQAIPQLAGGKVRAVALPARHRNAALPDVPTFAELGIKDFEAATWFMLIGPAGMSPSLIKAYQDAMVQIASDPEMRERIAKLGADLASRPLADLQAFVRSEAARWGKVVREAGIKAD